eukprot:5720935-Pyramimonas_sp.AAC.1
MGGRQQIIKLWNSNTQDSNNKLKASAKASKAKQTEARGSLPLSPHISLSLALSLSPFRSLHPFRSLPQPRGGRGGRMEAGMRMGGWGGGGGGAGG